MPADALEYLRSTGVPDEAFERTSLELIEYERTVGSVIPLDPCLYVEELHKYSPTVKYGYSMSGPYQISRNWTETPHPRLGMTRGFALIDPIVWDEVIPARRLLAAPTADAPTDVWSNYWKTVDAKAPAADLSKMTTARR